MYSVWLPGACSSLCWSHVRLSRVLCLRPLFWCMASSLVAVGILSTPTTRVLFILSLIFFLPGSAPGVRPAPSLSSRPLAGRVTRVGRPLGGVAGLSAASKGSYPLWDLPDYRRTAPAVVRCILEFQVIVTEGTVTYRTEQAHSNYLMLLLAIAVFIRLRRSRTRNERMLRRTSAGSGGPGAEDIRESSIS